VSGVCSPFFVFFCIDRTRFQINGVDITGATHETAVAILTGLERFVRIVAERELPCGRGEARSHSPGPEKSPKVFGAPKPYTGLYNANSHIANKHAGLRSASPSTMPPPQPTPAPRKFTPSAASTNSTTAAGGENEHSQVSRVHDLREHFPSYVY